MKKSTIIMMIALLAFLLACSGTTSEKQEPMTLSADALSFEGLGGEQKTIDVTSSTDWYARTTDSWLRIVIASGDGGDGVSPLRISVEDNEETVSRTGSITVANLSKETLTVTVTQAAGTGGSTNVRGISSAADLVAFAKAINEGGSVAPYLVDGVVKLNNDIDASSISEWTPIGSASNPLIYNIDGNNKSITNINWTIDVSENPMAGFVGAANGIKIRRLTLGTKGSGKISFTGENSGNVYAGAFAGLAENVTLEKVTGNVSLEVTGTTAAGSSLCLGGLVGYADNSCVLGGELRSTKGCIINGDITAGEAGRVGGFAGYSAGEIENCTFNGTVTAPSSGSYGPGWICSYSAALMEKVHDNYGYGYVGDTPSMMRNSMVNCTEGYDPETNTVDWTLDAYYDWKEVETRQLHSAVKYTHYSCTNVPREIHVLEVDITNPDIEITAAFAGEMVPNPNGNANANNGFNLRERLSDVCKRRRSEGQKILAGVNSTFFDSNDGISRGFHVEDCQPAYINNPAVVANLTNHLWGFTVFTDGTASCGKKTFNGKMRWKGTEYSYYTINDTTMRHANPTYQANLYTSRYVQYPYPSKKTITNSLAKDALYVICEYTGEPLKVNTGYASAKVVGIYDGRINPLSTGPYITSKNQIGIALSGTMAEIWSSARVGDTVEFSCQISVDDEVKPIMTQVSSMYQIMTNGQDASNTPGSSASLYSKYDPMTYPVVSADLKKVWLVEIDGRALWYSLGVKGYEMYRIAKKLGGAWVTRFDGGGSSAIWVLDSSGSRGALVNRPADARGERSSLNYLLIREK